MKDSLKTRGSSPLNHDGKESSNHKSDPVLGKSTPPFHQSTPYYSSSRTPQMRMHVCHLCDTNFSDISMFNLHMKAHSVESERERMKRKRPVIFFTVPPDASGHPSTKYAKHTNHQQATLTTAKGLPNEAHEPGTPGPVGQTSIHETSLSQSNLNAQERASLINSSPSSRIEKVCRAKASAISRSPSLLVKREPEIEADDHRMGATPGSHPSPDGKYPDEAAEDRTTKETIICCINNDSKVQSSPSASITDGASHIGRSGCSSKVGQQPGEGILQVAECGLCGLTFAAHILLDRHVQETHLNETGRFNCSFCPKDFASLTSVKRHVKAYHDGEHLTPRSSIVPPQSCSPGSSISSEESSRASAVFQGFSCSFCGRYFETPNQLQLHVSSEHPALTKIEIPRTQPAGKKGREHPVTYACPSCKAEFTLFDVFLEHLEVHVEEKEKSEDRRRMTRYKELFCSECKIDYESMEAFLKHLEACPGPRNMLTSKQNGHKSLLVEHGSQRPTGKTGEKDTAKSRASMVLRPSATGHALEETPVSEQHTSTGDLVNFYPDVVEVSAASGKRSHHQLCYSCQTCNTRFSKLDYYLDHLQTHETCMKAAKHYDSTTKRGQSVITSHENEINHRAETTVSSSPRNDTSRLSSEREANMVTVTPNKDLSPISLLPSDQNRKIGRPSSDDLVYHCHACRMCFSKLDLYLEHLEIHCEWAGRTKEDEQGAGNIVLSSEEGYTGIPRGQVGENKEQYKHSKVYDLPSLGRKLRSPPSSIVVEIEKPSYGLPSNGRTDHATYHSSEHIESRSPLQNMSAMGSRLSKESNGTSIVHHYAPPKSHVKEPSASVRISRHQSESQTRRYQCQVCSLELNQFDSYLAHVASHNIKQKQESPRTKEQVRSYSSSHEISVEHEKPVDTKLVYCVIPVLLGPRVRKNLEGDGPYFMCQFCNTFYCTLEQLQNHVKDHYPSMENKTSLLPESPSKTPVMNSVSYSRSSPRVLGKVEGIINSPKTPTPRQRLSQSNSPSEVNAEFPSSVDSGKATPDSAATLERSTKASFSNQHSETQTNDAGDIPMDANAAYACKTCHLGFVSLDDIMKHIAETGHDSRIEPARNVESGRIACPICGVKVRSQEKFMTHLRHQHLFKKSHVCPACNLGFARRVDLLLHMDQQHHGSSYACAERSSGENASDSTQKKDLANMDRRALLSASPPFVSMDAHDNTESEDDSNDVSVDHDFTGNEDDGTTPDSVFICQPCRRQFSEENEFLQHIQTHEPVRFVDSSESGSTSSTELQNKSIKTVKTGTSPEEQPVIAKYWSLASDANPSSRDEAS